MKLILTSQIVVLSILVCPSSLQSGDHCVLIKASPTRMELTIPPEELSILLQVAAELCFQDQLQPDFWAHMAHPVKAGVICG